MKTTLPRDIEQLDHMAGESWPGLLEFYVCLVALIPCRLRASSQFVDDLDRVDVASRFPATEGEAMTAEAATSPIPDLAREQRTNRHLPLREEHQSALENESRYSRA